jgi:F-type H+-transporting ATPase subunit b
MSLDSLTIFFEIINFLVLVWILQRFLYKPIKKAIHQRQADLEASLQAARLREQEAETEKNNYQQQQVDWKAHQSEREKELQQKIAKEREAALAKLRQELDAEKIRHQVVMDQGRQERARQMEEEISASALKLSALILKRLSGAELDQLLLNIFIEDILGLPKQKHEKIHAALAKEKGTLKLSYVRPLSEDQCTQITAAFRKAFDTDISLVTVKAPDLISGFRIKIGAEVLHANLGDELAFFQAGNKYVPV